MKRADKFEQVIAFFRKNKPDAETELQYTNPYELLVAVILSAQCTDRRVNLVTPALFEAYPTVEVMATATSDDIFPFIRSVSYPNNKAKHLAGMARMIVNDFEGKVPSEVDDLVKLPGVGRKTANVIASVVFNRPAMAVDTHVFRVSARLGLTVGAKTPLAAEKQLIKYLPEEWVAVAHHWLILHGRYTCLARKPKCDDCGLASICTYHLKKKKTTKPRMPIKKN